ncbi:cobaltochelatase CobT-related protein [Pararhizobium qamdonense]|uniref:cobaltochelatase CobT-related protein n=1 Tax=Pararhizobium qamdonense TaxID=3031126 RepID=UPI0023E13D02|nr:hypothetical protein [Pararhizobium qamdonense]
MNNDIVILREAIKKIIPMLAGKGLIVTQMGTQAYVQPHPVTGLPHRVNIPLLPDNADPAFVVAIQGFIDHEVAHVLFTDFRYKAREKSKRLHNLHNIIEDTMIERLMGEDFPGSKRNIARLAEYFLKNVTDVAIKDAKSKQDEFSYLLVPLTRALAGHQVFQNWMDDHNYWEHELVNAFMDRFSQASKNKMPLLRTTEETYEIALEVEAILYPPPPPAPPQPEPQEEEQDDQSQGDGSDDEQEPSEGEDDKDHSDEEQSGDGEGKGEREHTQDNDKASGGEGESDEEEKEDDAGDGENEGSGEGEEKADEEDGNDAADDSDGSSDADSDEEGDAGAGDGEPDEKNGETDDADDQNGSGQSAENDDDGDAPENADASAGEDPAPDASDEDGNDDESSPQSGDQGEADQSEADADEDADDECPGEGSDDAAESDEADEGEEAGGKPDLSNVAIEDAGDENNDEDDKDSAEATEEENDLEVAGIGYDKEQNPFSEMTEEDLEEKDLSSALVKIIVKEAIQACRAADYTVFTREYDVIKPVDVPENFNSRHIVELEDQTRALTGVMQKDIERMMAAQSRVFNVAGQRSGKLNSAGLHRLTAGDPRVFSRREEIRAKDTAVALLSDCSGSMKGAPMATALSASYALAQVLERCNIPAECMGFTTAAMWGHGGVLSETQIQQFNDDIALERSKSGVNFSRLYPIYMPIFKEFNERINAEVKKRFAYQRKVQPHMGGNIDGESLEYAAMRLARRKEKRKVIIVLSDGFPAGADGDDEHLKYMVGKLTNLGFDLVGIGIKSNAVERFYDNSLVLNSVEELPKAVMGELKKILMK